MDLVGKIDKLIVDTTVAGDVAQNKAQGKVDVIGGECPDGMKYCKKRKTCVPVNESIVAGATYASGNSTIAGSGQTRVWGNNFDLIDALKTKEPISDKMADKTKENLFRRDLKFDTLLGAYVPKETDDE